ncbi:hypothetical protein CRV08_06090 [Halarcobacter ebronensis]|uniref:Uncharacterized protein n=1 Tax=Halarcobacter ebronensis TaxID=1462615 RepID=A0A4Q0YIS1_9BACT|nr:hypothetical protein [Halarcobacter ebronensis]RXJ68999.1 hypothetical protein CRV08_06090 [Halarcobacter ebronensis]
MKKIVYVSIAPLTRSLIERLYVDVLYESDIDVEFWDITGIYYKKNEKLEYPYIKQINTKEELKTNINRLSKNEVLINIQIGFEYKYIFLFRLFNDFKTSFFYIGAFPISNEKKRYILIKKFFSLRSIKKIVEIFVLKLGWIKKYDIIFSTSSEARSIFLGSKIMRINYIDYEKVIQEKKSDTEKYVVFLDQNLTSHPDFSLNNSRHIDQVKYINDLNKLFQYIEKKFSIQVVIALHPTSRKYDFWSKDKQYFDKLYTLVNNSKFVIGHYSTSLYAAISVKKPILLTITNDMISNIPLSVQIIDGLERNFNIKKINLDDNYYIESYPNVDIDLYEKFLYDYCTDKLIENKIAKDYFRTYLRDIK